MQRLVASKVLHRQILSHKEKKTQILIKKIIKPTECDVFINHRGPDTKLSFASLLYDHLYQLDLCPFLDNKTMKPGDKLFEKIEAAIKGCKIGVAMLSPRYCESYFCLHELALMMELKKKVIPVFCDVKPTELRVVDDGRMKKEEVQRFCLALEEAKYTVGLFFNSRKGNWSNIVRETADTVMQSLEEMEKEEKQMLY